jgi:hypothetical protein
MTREESISVPVRVHLRKVSTGEVRVYDDSLYTTATYDGLFIWDEGNYACDCNRRLFWDQAVGVETPDGEDRCGGGAFVVDRIERIADGVIVYSETDDGKAAR